MLYIVWGIAGIVTYLRTIERVGKILGFIGFGWVTFEMVILGIAVLTGSGGGQEVPISIFCLGSAWLVWRFWTAGCLSLKDALPSEVKHELMESVDEMPVVEAGEWDKKLCLGTIREEKKKKEGVCVDG